MCKKLIYLLSLVFVLSTVLTGSANAADPNLLLWLEFDGDANDSSNYDRLTTVTGSLTYGPGVIGQGADLGSNANYVTITGYDGILGANPFSITAWVRTTDATGTLVGWGSTASGATRFEFRPNDDRLRAESNGNVQGDTTMNDDEWHHVAVTVKANAAIEPPDVKLYLDGFDDTKSSDDNSALAMAAGYDVRIGIRHSAIDRNFNSWFDDLRIYDYELSWTEIRILAGNVEPLLIEPLDEDILAAAGTTLKWTPGVYADNDVGGHEVYLSESPEDVNAGAGGALYATLDGSAVQKSVTGLDVGKVYYWKVDAVNDSHPDKRWSSEIWSFFVPPLEAYDPFPPDEQTFVDPNVLLEWSPGLGMAWQDVYIGTNFADVNTSEVPYDVEIYDPNYYPGPLAYDANYYWRIDTNDGDGNTVKGLVWSFKTLPDVAITDVNLVCWWTFDEGEGTTAVDWSGHNNHGTLNGDPQFVTGYDGDMALDFDGDGDCVIREFSEQTYAAFTIAFWAKAAVVGQIQYASVFSSYYPNSAGFQIDVDGGDPGNYRIHPGSGSRLYGPVTTDWVHLVVVGVGTNITLYYNGSEISTATLDGVEFNQFAVGLNRNREADKFFDGMIDDVRIYDEALSQTEIWKLSQGLKASNPSPSDGAQYDGANVMLSWRAGKYAAFHNVYFGTDSNDMLLVSENRPLDSNSYGPVAVELGRSYYWAVDEVNDPCVWPGDTWSFDVKEYLVVDDFDSYAGTFPPNEPNLLGTWKDGSTNSTGSTVLLETEFAGNSMKYVYDNNESPFYSEAELTYDAAVDWTAGGVKALELRFGGDVNNSADLMYIALEDADDNSAVVAIDDANELAQESWQVWNIALQDFNDDGVDLTKVKKFIIGFGDGTPGGGSGVAYIDDIRLYPPRCLPEYIATSFDDDCVTDLTDIEMLLRYWLASEYDVVAEEPNDNRLQAYYDFNETSGTTAYDSSGKGRNATVDANGADAWDPCGYDGYCLAFDGNFAVSIPNDVFSNIQKQVTVSVWLQMDANVNPNTVGRAEFGAGPADPNETWDRLAWIQDRPEEHIGQWNHYAFVKDADDGLMRIYHNGLLVAQNTEAFQLMSGADAGLSRIGSAIDDAGGYYEGKMDEFRVYDYALSHAEVLYLVLGSGSELYQPLQPALSPVDPYEDGKIDFRDFAALARWWLEEQLWP